MEGQYRSEKEAQIARMLKRHSLSFRHEYPLAVMDRGRVRLWYPDIMIPEQGVIIEYGGMPENAECRAREQHKREVYGELGLPALFLGPNDFRGYWPVRILDWLDLVQQHRLERVRQARETAGRGF